MAVNLSPVGGVAAQFFDNNGNVLTGGKLYTYAAGTTTPQTTYTNAAGSVAQSNPIILNASGRVPTGEIWLTDGFVYKFVLTDANDVTIATYDNVVGINSNFVNFTNKQEIQTATAGQTVFTLTTMDYQPGTNSLTVFVDGVNQYGSGAQYAYVETNSTTVTFNTGLHVGAEVKFTTSQLNSTAGNDAALVSYVPPFTGSAGTNVAAKLSETVSVKDFGAVGDGVADDTAAIQAAFDSGRAIYFPSGRYRCGTVTSTQPLSVFGEFYGNTIIEPIQAGSGACWDLQNFVSTTDGSNATTIKDLTFWRNYPAENVFGTGTAIKSSRAKVLFERLDFKGNEYGIHGAANHFYIWYKNVWHSYSKHLVDSPDNNAVSYTDCYFNGFDIRNAISVNFVDVDCSGNMDFDNKAYRLVDPFIVTFNGLYVEWLDTATAGPKDIFELVGTNLGGNLRYSVVINGLFCNAVSSAKTANLFVVNNVDLIVDGAYYYKVGYLVNLLNAGTAIFRNVKSGVGVIGLKAGTSNYSQQRYNDLRFADTIYADGYFTIPSFGSGVNNEVGQTKKLATASTSWHYGLYSDSTRGAVIGLRNNNTLTLRGESGIRFEANTQTINFVSNKLSPGSDNVLALGFGGERWTEVHAANGTIVTSDGNEKQDIESLTETEKRVAASIKNLVKKFRFKEAVVSKGDNARIHVGVIAQDVKAAFEAEGLDGHRYGLFCYDEWDDVYEPDENGNMKLVKPAGSRYGIRYEELLAFVISAM